MAEEAGVLQSMGLQSWTGLNHRTTTIVSIIIHWSTLNRNLTKWFNTCLLANLFFLFDMEPRVRQAIYGTSV